MLLEGIALREKVFGSDHPDTWTARENLSGLWLAQGRYEDLVPMVDEVVVDEVVEGQVVVDGIDLAPGIVLGGERVAHLGVAVLRQIGEEVEVL